MRWGALKSKMDEAKANLSDLVNKAVLIPEFRLTFITN